MDGIQTARAEVQKLELESRELRAQAEALREEKIAAGISAEAMIAASSGDESDPAAKAFLEIDAAHKAADEKKVAAEHARDRLNRMYEWGGQRQGAEMPRPGGGDGGRVLSLGHRFTGSEQYGRLTRAEVRATDAGFRAAVERGFDSPIQMLSRDEFMALLDGQKYGATTLTGGGATSAGPFIQNDLIPGFIGYRRKRPLLSAMVGNSETDSDVVEYVNQTAPTNAAAETAEDTAAPESTLPFETLTANVREITHFVPVTLRALADAGQVRGIVNNELITGVLDRLDTQLASGNGSGQNLAGIYNTSGIGIQALGGDSRADCIHKSITKVRVAAGVLSEPDAVGLHPNDYEQLVLETDANGQYVMGPPSMAEARSIWGVPLLTSTVFTDGTPIVGDFAGSAMLWIREALAVTTGLDGNDFTKRRVSILAALRIAFAVQRAGGFCTPTGF